ncbi:Glycerol kinase [Patulibacter medicamentivorans]|uniref:Glycerol kinase n=1 Tax=Patulibacter medicamentivorans TaxID=1097667 RepID=H0E6B6_9ACTN|nr:glycerol kinase GlpK [Patulibacter medicamentivorans]EHN10760.1 Glycerol kinase [Patulibacter medicamentivorans]
MILAIDQGTTGTTCFVVDGEGELIGRGYREFAQHFPQPGWVEHDAAEIWAVTREVALEACDDAGVDTADLRAIGITNQRETICVWDPATGEPLHRAIVWQDRRTAGICDRLREQGHEPLIRERTGLVLDPYFSGTKIAWLLEHAPELRERALRGTAVFGTIDSWLLFQLTGEHVTDPSNASRTMLYRLDTGTWDEELCELLGVPPRALPEIRPSIGGFGTVRPGVLGDARCPVAGVAGDQQAALYGQACLDRGEGKNTYGTGSFVLVNTGDQVPAQREGLLRTVAWRIGDRTMFAYEASVFATGAAVQWLRDGLRIIDSAGETEPMAASLSSNDGVYLVPAFAGLGSPHWDPYARGTVTGLTRGSTREHLARATLESIAYQTLDAVRAMEAAAHEPLRVLKADGGATANRWLMQFQADMLGVPVVVPAIHETTALGAAYMAGVGVGAWNQRQVTRTWRQAAAYEPAMSRDHAETLHAGWRDAVSRSLRQVLPE